MPHVTRLGQRLAAERARVDHRLGADQRAVDRHHLTRADQHDVADLHVAPRPLPRGDRRPAAAPPSAPAARAASAHGALAQKRSPRAPRRPRTSTRRRRPRAPDPARAHPTIATSAIVSTPRLRSTTTVRPPRPSTPPPTAPPRRATPPGRRTPRPQDAADRPPRSPPPRSTREPARDARSTTGQPCAATDRGRTGTPASRGDRRYRGHAHTTRVTRKRRPRIRSGPPISTESPTTSVETSAASQRRSPAPDVGKYGLRGRGATRGSSRGAGDRDRAPDQALRQLARN